MRKQLPFFAAIFTMFLFSASVHAQSEGVSSSQPDEKITINIVDTTDRSFELEASPAFPNPATRGYVNITGQHFGAPCEDCFTVTVYAVETGELVYENGFELVNGDYEYRLDISRFRSGMYYLVYTARDLQQRELLLVN